MKERQGRNPRPRGLANLMPEQRQAIARKGGQAAQARGTAHRWTVEEARAAGKKGSARYALRHQSEEAGFDTEKKSGADAVPL